MHHSGQGFPRLRLSSAKVDQPITALQGWLMLICPTLPKCGISRFVGDDVDGSANIYLTSRWRKWAFLQADKVWWRSSVRQKLGNTLEQGKFLSLTFFFSAPKAETDVWMHGVWHISKWFKLFYMGTLVWFAANMVSIPLRSTEQGTSMAEDLKKLFFNLCSLTFLYTNSYKTRVSLNDIHIQCGQKEAWEIVGGVRGRGPLQELGRLHSSVCRVWRWGQTTIWTWPFGRCMCSSGLGCNATSKEVRSTTQGFHGCPKFGKGVDVVAADLFTYVNDKGKWDQLNKIVGKGTLCYLRLQDTSQKRRKPQ